MNKSRDYLASLSIKQRKILSAKVSPDSKQFYQYLYQLGKYLRTPSRKMAATLQVATKGKVKQSDFDREAMDKLS